MMGKTIIGILALISAGSAAAATVSPTMTASYSISPGTNVTPSTTGAAANYYQLIVGESDALTTFSLVDTSPENRDIAYKLFSDTNNLSTGITFDNAAPLLSAVKNDPSSSQSALFIFSYLLQAGNQYVLMIDSVDANTTSTQTNISAVPLPAAAWLFGSALVGFMAMSNRRKF